MARPKKRSVAFFAMAAAVLLPFLAISAASADPDPNKKVYVCKYVGTPGVDERLQTGQNPIEVSVNSIQNNQWNGNVPGWFSDAHDRSYVLGYVPMTPEPTAANCPGPDNPPEQVPVPTQAWIDPCNPPGVQNNVDWKDPLPADTSAIDWSEFNKVRIASLVDDDSEWADKTTAPKVFNLPADDGKQCEQPEVIEVPAAATVTDPCGSGNAAWNVPADTPVLDWSDENGHLIVKILGAGVTFPGGATSHDFGLAKETNTASCGEIGVAGNVKVSSACESITIGQPTVSPADASAVVKLDGKSVKPDTYGVKAGSHVVELSVNGQVVFAEKVEVKSCGGDNPPGHTPTGGNPDLENPTYAHTGH